MSIDFTIIDAATGKVRRHGSVGDEAAARLQCRDGEAILLELPPPGCLWREGAWQADWDIERARAVAAIEAERERRATAPIEVDGVLFDADASSQQIAGAKLAAVLRQGGDMPAEQLWWRSADNVNHAFDSTEQYADFLGALLLACTNRTSAIRAWAAQLKAQARTASSLDSIRSTTDFTT